MQAHTQHLVQQITWIIVIVSSLWVLADARAIGIRKGQVRGLGNLSPAGWFIACLLLWFPAFPYYLYKRREFRRINGQRPIPTRGVESPQPALAAAASQPTAAATPAAPAPVAWAQPARLSGAQAVVWGVVLLVLGLGLGGWGAWRSYQDIDTWQQARAQLQEMSRLTPDKIAQAKQEAAHSDNPFTQFSSAFMSPEVVEIAKANAQSEMQGANNRLLTDLPAAIVGLMLVLGGHRLLGRGRGRA
ncbi:MAG: hypothetical protein RBR52_11750 [Thiomonas sp.]|uniref:hypothetical protein n=1 Tax=Thiomonas sp. TaxID=2047785 RepID=UPI002A36F245|nr:hypothetical protein [Thiomonas sp.]MDY0331152.1 hypothetical protein [Thiomonas sp.]